METVGAVFTMTGLVTVRVKVAPLVTYEPLPAPMIVVSPAATLGLPPATTVFDTMSACAAVGTASTARTLALTSASARRPLVLTPSDPPVRFCVRCMTCLPHDAGRPLRASLHQGCGDTGHGRRGSGV